MVTSLPPREEGGGASRSTDPAAGSSAATDVSLREFVMQSMRDLDRHLSNEIKRVEDALAAEVELRRARREDDMRAVDKAEESMTRRLDAMNELREQLNSQALTFVNVSEFKAEMDKLETLIERNRQDIDSTRGGLLPRETYETTVQQWSEWRAGVDRVLSLTAGERSGSRLTWGTMAGLLAAFATVIGLLVVAANWLAGS